MKNLKQTLEWNLPIVILALCTLAVLALAWLGGPKTVDPVGQNITLPQPGTMTVEMVPPPEDYAHRTRIPAVVVDAGTNSVYPLGAELSVELGPSDGGQPGWEVGQRLQVEFQTYANGYSEENHFYNLLFPANVTAVAAE